MYRTHRNILVQRKFRYSERAKRGLNEAVEWIINVDFIDTLKCTNTNTMIKVARNSYQLTFCSVVLILPLIGNLLMYKFVKQYRLYAALHLTFVKHSVAFLQLDQSH